MLVIIFSLTERLFYLFSASLSGTNLETIYIFSHEATAQFMSDYSENYNGFNATYTAFNESELNSKCYVCVCEKEGVFGFCVSFLSQNFGESTFSV